MDQKLRPLAATQAARVRAAARATAAAAHRAASIAVARGRAVARAAGPVVARAPQALRAASAPTRRALYLGAARLSAAARRAVDACSPYVDRLGQGLQAISSAVVRGLLWLHRALGLAALGLALATAGAAVIAPLALVASAGYGILEATAPSKSAAVVEPPVDTNVDFIDRFTRLDRRRWRVSDWSNTPLADNDWRPSQIAVTPEGLSITMAPSPPGVDKPYVSGEFFTHERYVYGYFEARMRVPRGEGVVVGFFTFTRPEGNTTWNEIDMELLGRDPRWLELALHVGGESRNKIVVLPFDASADFHTYAFEWRPDVIRWYVDNILVHEERGARVEQMTRPQNFYLNLWNSSRLYRWVGRINPDEAPWTLTVSCMARAEEYRGVSLCAP
jgi:beta-glucanase (GH16 family)